MSNIQNWGKGQTTSDKKGKVYTPRITTFFILGFAILNMIVGIASLIIGIIGTIDSRREIIHGIAGVYLIVIGLSVILFSSLVYIIGALSKDVYDLLYFADYRTAQNDIILNNITEHMRRLENNQEAIKSGIAVISSKLEYENETTRANRFRKEINNSQIRSDEEQYK